VDRQQLEAHFYPETRFGGFSRVDGTVVFFSRVRALAANARLVVDVGCGRGQRQEDPCAFRRELADLRSEAREVIGLDVSPAGKDNPFIDEFRQIRSSDQWPIANNSVDLVVSDYVLEHIADPNAFFSEVARVLRVGGYFCARTPNKWGYVAMLSMLLPQHWHAPVIVKVQANRREEDVFPTFYRSNAAPIVRKHLRACGLEGVVLAFEGEPNYLAFNHLLYGAGTVAHRILPALLRSTLMIFAEKPSPSGTTFAPAVFKTHPPV
jgi:SAM-dependent methyltransferase